MFWTMVKAGDWEYVTFMWHRHPWLAIRVAIGNIRWAWTFSHFCQETQKLLDEYASDISS